MVATAHDSVHQYANVCTRACAVTLPGTLADSLQLTFSVVDNEVAAIVDRQTLSVSPTQMDGTSIQLTTSTGAAASRSYAITSITRAVQNGTGFVVSAGAPSSDVTLTPMTMTLSTASAVGLSAGARAPHRFCLSLDVYAPM